MFSKEVYFFIIILLTMLLSNFCINKAFGQYLPTDWRSSLAAGQGESYTAWANDGASLFYNPAGLSILHNHHSHKSVNDVRGIFPDEFEANEQVLSAMHTNPNNWAQNMLDSAQANFSKPSYIAVQAFPYVVFGGKNTPTFLIGFPVRAENSMVFADSVNINNATMKSITTVSGAVGFADSSNIGLFRWGISARPNYRTQYYTQAYSYSPKLTSESYIDLVKKNAVTSTGIGLDAGFMWTLADFWLPTIAASVRNIPTGCIDTYINPITYVVETMCGAVRKGATSADPNESNVDPTEFKAGVSLTPRGRIASTIINLRLSADAFPVPLKIGVRNYGISSIDVKNLVHVGGELFFGSALAKNTFGLRGGYMNQTATWGGSLNIGLFQLGYASYTILSYVKDPSTAVIKEVKERRHMLNIGLSL